jgi:hypothetical protein
LLGLQDRVPKASAGNWFQTHMVLFTKEYFLTSDVNGVTFFSTNGYKNATSKIASVCTYTFIYINCHLGYNVVEPGRVIILEEPESSILKTDE